MPDDVQGDVGEQEVQAAATADKPTRDRVAEIQRRKDREIEGVRKEAKTLQDQVARMQAELAESRGYVSLLKERGELTEDEERRMQWLAERESTTNNRFTEAVEYERQLTSRLLQAEYGVPLNVLEGLTTPAEMELAALKWERTKSQKPANQADEDDSDSAKPAATEQTPARKGSSFDLGTGSSITKNPIDMTQDEFNALTQRLKAGAMRDATRRR